MKISDLKSRITFQTPTRTKVTGGGYTTSWANITDTPTVWANVSPASGYEQMKAEALESNITHKVTIRRRSDITAKMKILVGSRELAIKYVTNKDEGKKRWLELYCVEGDPS